MVLSNQRIFKTDLYFILTLFPCIIPSLDLLFQTYPQFSLSIILLNLYFFYHVFNLLGFFFSINILLQTLFYKIDPILPFLAI